MTLSPVEPVRMSIDPRRYSWCAGVDPSPVCESPGCWEVWGLQRHHIVRRSATGGPLEYITIDGLVCRNVCWLCRECHEQVTGLIGGHRAAIMWNPGGLTPGNWAWCTPHPPGTQVFVSKTGQPWFSVGPLIGESPHEHNPRS